VYAGHNIVAATDLADPELYSNGFPHERFRELRRHEPVAWQPSKFWAVTRYHDIVHVLKTPKLFSSWRGGALLADPPHEFLAKLREGMLNRDPPDHTELRRLVNKAFSPRRVEQLEDRIAAHARELVASIEYRGSCDFATEVAGKMPLFVICEILGVPIADRDRLYALTARMFGSEIAVWRPRTSSGRTAPSSVERRSPPRAKTSSAIC
jgi:cholest-4-en-3-one 26-monooxygenase